MITFFYRLYILYSDKNISLQAVRALTALVGWSGLHGLRKFYFRRYVAQYGKTFSANAPRITVFRCKMKPLVW